jgi:hypothetical protein
MNDGNIATLKGPALCRRVPEGRRFGPPAMAASERDHHNKVVNLSSHWVILQFLAAPFRKELIVKNPQLQGAIEGRDNPAGENAYQPLPVDAKPLESAEEPGYSDSLDIPLDYGIVMDAVRDAVRANQ